MIDVNIVGTDRRYVLDLALKEIDVRCENIRYASSRYNDWHNRDERKILDEKKVSATARKLLTQLRAVDDQIMTLKKRLTAVEGKLKQAIDGKATLSIVRRRGAAHDTYVLRETAEAATDRIEGNATERAKKVLALKDLRQRFLIAAAAGSSLEPLMNELTGNKPIEAVLPAEHGLSAVEVDD